MEKIKLEIELPKEAADLGLGIAKLIKATEQALADGFQIGSDLPAIVMASYSDLVKAVDGISKLDDEAKADLSGVIKAIQLPIQDAVFSFIKKG